MLGIPRNEDGRLHVDMATPEHLFRNVTGILKQEPRTCRAQVSRWRALRGVVIHTYNVSGWGCATYQG